MFKKPLASLKSFSPLRSSDKRRLRDEILASFPALKDMDALLPENTTVNAIIAPDGLQSARFTSYIEEPGTLYTDAEGTPLWIKISHSKKDSLIVPSIYMLWKFPTLIPALTTWNPVVDKLRNGADLMIPGVITSSGMTIPDLEEGSLVAICARGNQYPLAIGTMAVSGKVIESSRGSLPPKGKAVHLLHVHLDQLWAMGSKIDFPLDWAQGLDGTHSAVDDYETSDDDSGDEGREQPTQKAPGADSEMSKNMEGISLADSPENLRTEQQVQSQTTLESTETTEAEVAVELTSEEVDLFLQEALLQVLKHKILEANAKELLPMNASTLYSSYVLPNRARGRAAEADIKKSSWKKLAKWLKASEKQGLIKCKEIKGELFLLSVNWNHPQLKAFGGHKTVEQLAAQQAKLEAQASRANSDVTELEVLEVYRPNSTSGDLFEVCGRSKDGYFSWSEVKALLTTYVKEKQLSDPKNQRMIRVDEILQLALFGKKGEASDRVARDGISDRLMSNMVLYHHIGYRGQQPRFLKGGVKPILVTQEIRTGRKTVTKVSGLESFLIDVDAFAQEIQVLCASSVAITPLVGASPKLNLREVMAQGPQFKNISAVLQEKGVPKKYIEFLDKTKKK